MNKEPVIKTDSAKILSLPAETKFAENGIVSRTLLSTPNLRVVLFGFAEGQELTEHTSTQHAMVQILSGECDFSLEGMWHRLKTGDLLYMPPHLPHSVKAPQNFSMLLTLGKPDLPPGSVSADSLELGKTGARMSKIGEAPGNPLRERRFKN